MKTLLVFVILLHVSHHASGVEVVEGEESVLLPCLVSVSDSSDSTVVWNRNNLTPPMVHLRDQNVDELSEQNPQYKDRTSMRTDALDTGDLSLTLRKPTISDSGTYTCTVRRGGEDLREITVQLLVKEPPPPLWPMVLAGVLVPLIVLPAAVGLIMYQRMKDKLAKQFLMEVDSGKGSVLLPFITTDHSPSVGYLVGLCRRRPLLPKDVTVEWTDTDNCKVHVYENGSDQPEEQHQFYRGRTEMKRNLLKTGDLSLTLKHPTYDDVDTFICTVWSREGNVLMKKHVDLRVKVPQVVVNSGVESVQLPCETTVDLAEDVTVEWRNSNNMKVHVYQNSSDQPEEQDQFYRGRTEMKRNLQKPGDLSLTLKHPTYRDRGTYICTVYSRERNILMKKDVKLWVKEKNVTGPAPVKAEFELMDESTPLKTDQSV